MDFIDGGFWNFGDGSYPQSEMTFFAGTFCKHPLAMAAAREVLTKIKMEGKSLLQDLNLKTSKLAEELNSFFMSKRVPIEIVYFGSLFRFKFSGNIDWLFYLLNMKGIYIWEGRNMFLSTAHSDADIAAFITKVIESVDALIAIDYFSDQKRSGAQALAVQEQTVWLPMIEPQLRFSALSQYGAKGLEASNICLAVRLEGRVDENVLKKSVEEGFKRHDALSAKYIFEKNTVEFRRTQTTQLQVIDWSQEQNIESKLRGWMEQQSQRHFNGEEVPLVFTLVKTMGFDVLTLVGQHIAMDGVSLAVLTDEIAKIYTATIRNESPKLDKVTSFEEFMTDYPLRLERQKEAPVFWQQELKNFPDLPKLIRHPSAEKYSGGRVRRDIAPEPFKKMRNFGFRNSSSLLMTLLAHTSFLLKKEFGINEAVMGVPVMGHTSVKQSMVGNCVNIIPIHIKSEHMTAPVDLIPPIREKILECFRYADYPYTKIEAQLKRPLFNISVNVEPINELPEFGDLQSELICHPVLASEYPIIINAMKLNGGLQIEMDYQNQVFTKVEAEKFLSDLVDKLEAL
jgi:hypothetical protein